ncbi:glycosyltransferase [Vitellibacter sp. q18]|nr:glycosyltransferase [Aequorivita lutea]
MSLVSIIVPCYNQAVYLYEALESVVKQSYTNWECIIINDGSTDNTIDIANIWISRDTRFKYLEQENKGVVNARNYGIKKAIGDYILPLDADDKISEDYIMLAIERFDNQKNLKLVYCEAAYFGDKTGKWYLPEFTLAELAVRNIIFNCAVFKKKDWESIGGYDDNFYEGLEDWEFWINLLKNGGAVYKIPKICFYYRQLSNSRNVSISPDQYEKIYQRLSLKHTAFFIKYLGSFKLLNDRIIKLEGQKVKLIKQVEAKNKSLTVKKIFKALVSHLK